MYNYKPVEKIVDRCVELWKIMLLHPTFDNGDDSKVGGMTMVLAMLDQANRSMPTQEQLDIFGKYLKKTLMTPNEHDYYVNYFGTDYSPDKYLGDAMDAAGITSSAPWKTNVHLSNDYVAISAGYAAEMVYHYPLENGKWLVTTLHGSDISLVFDYINGKNPSFNITD